MSWKVSIGRQVKKTYLPFEAVKSIFITSKHTFNYMQNVDYNVTIFMV